MTETTIDLADVQRLAATLDAVNLDSKDRATAHAVFAVAGQGTVGVNDDEVSGFAVDAFLRFDSASPSLTGNLFDSFQWGVGRHGREELNPQPLPP